MYCTQEQYSSLMNPPYVHKPHRTLGTHRQVHTSNTFYRQQWKFKLLPKITLYTERVCKCVCKHGTRSAVYNWSFKTIDQTPLKNASLSENKPKAGSLKMNTALEYSTRVVQEGGRRCKKSTLNDLIHLTPLRIPFMNPPQVVDFKESKSKHT